MFVKYQHVCRLGGQETYGLLDGKCYVQPKIDGTNGILWFEDNTVHAGSRKRELSEDSDNQGFYSMNIKDTRYLDFFKSCPDLRLFGEWLKPHSLRTYKEDAWDKFYVFDVGRVENGEIIYLSYDVYQPLLERFGIEYVPVLLIKDNPTNEDY